ncbi:hypothetical protein B0H19DRAFT_1265411 [Mycena capillaripes]|nr:hypothetical protein B0H19DRAFT_1265411 [Mycena capillaripes]
MREASLLIRPSDMQSFFLLLAAALGTSAAVASRAPLEINTPVPGAAQCEPLLITWSGGIPPYVVAYAPVLHEIPHPMPLVDFGLVTGTSLVWIVNATLGQSLILEVTDDEATGLNTVTSAPFDVIVGGTSLPRLRFVGSLTYDMLQPEMGASMGTEPGGLFTRKKRSRRPGMGMHGSSTHDTDAAAVFCCSCCCALRRLAIGGIVLRALGAPRACTPPQ